MKALKFIMFLFMLCYALAFFPFMLFGEKFHDHTWDNGQTFLLICLWMMSMVVAILYYPGKHKELSK